jgi:hypothetical protein
MLGIRLYNRVATYLAAAQDASAAPEFTTIGEWQ